MDKRNRPAKVKNKTAADVQITAEQILREAQERAEPPLKAPQQRITDAEELAEYHHHKRKQFEDALRRNRHVISAWLRYAAWEESQREWQRARSIYERALEVEMRNPAIWIKYAEMEMRQKNVNLARNLWDRACTQLPRVDQFWYKYAYMEEMLGNVPAARQIFERWMQWKPAEEAWDAYIKMELRYKETERARGIYERFVECHPEPKHWIKWAKFEEQQNDLERCRQVYESALQYLGDEHVDAKLLGAFARFETKVKEYDRARAVYKFALARLPKTATEHLYKAYTQFEKQYGEREGIEDVIVSKRRWQYEEELKHTPSNYDIWFDYVRLEESAGHVERTREVYERAIANVPPAPDKRLWRRYIYLWINYALFEELDARDVERTRQVYRQCLDLIPHRSFTFAKIWLLYARFEVRQMNLAQARKSLGYALGICPKDKLFKGYIELEIELREFDRVRTLYGRYLAHNPANCHAWIKFAESERILDDKERCRGIFEIAISQPVLDMPEVLWKAYIDFELEEEEYGRTRELYDRLLQRTEHVKVWISYARFELSAMDTAGGEEGRVAQARDVFTRGYKRMKEREVNEERVLLLEAWRDFEQAHGSAASIKAVKDRFPRVIKKRRRVDAGEGGAVNDGSVAVAWEEYYDYIFPDDEVAKPNLKFLAMAHKWKQQQQQQQQQEDQPAGTEDAAAPTEDAEPEIKQEEEEEEGNE
ncbi:NineTeen Complex (NTC) component [Sorochytrium milnesiophthora]